MIAAAAASRPLEVEGRTIEGDTGDNADIPAAVLVPTIDAEGPIEDVASAAIAATLGFGPL